MKLFFYAARIKNYFSQGNLYMAVANFFVTLATWHAAAHLTLPLWLIVIGGFFLIITIGALDFYLIKKHEVAHANTMNDIKEQLDRIEKKVNYEFPTKFSGVGST